MIFKRSMVSELANSAGGVFTVLFTIVLAVGMVRILSLAAGGALQRADEPASASDALTLHRRPDDDDALVAGQ